MDTAGKQPEGPKRPRWQRIDRALDLLLIGLPLLLAVACVITSYTLKPYRMDTGDAYLDWYGNQLMDSADRVMAADPLLPDYYSTGDYYLLPDFRKRFEEARTSFSGDPRYWMEYADLTRAELWFGSGDNYSEQDSEAAYEAVMREGLPSPGGSPEMFIPLECRKIEAAVLADGVTRGNKEGRPSFIWNHPEDVTAMLEQAGQLPVQDSVSRLLQATYWSCGGKYGRAREQLLAIRHEPGPSLPDMNELMIKSAAGPNTAVMASRGWSMQYPSSIYVVNSDLRSGLDELAEQAWLAGDYEAIDILRQAIIDSGRGSSGTILGQLMTTVNLGKVDSRIYKITTDPYELSMMLELRARKGVWRDKVRSGIGRELSPWLVGRCTLEGALSGGRGFHSGYGIAYGRLLQDEYADLLGIKSDWDAIAGYSYSEMAFPDGWTPSASDLRIAEGEIANNPGERMYREASVGDQS
ncbi:hypothetical protein KDL29_09655 [bacterium]|nr:hypothetical protein [bacterium]